MHPLQRVGFHLPALELADQISKPGPRSFRAAETAGARAAVTPARPHPPPMHTHTSTRPDRRNCSQIALRELPHLKQTEHHRAATWVLITTPYSKAGLGKRKPTFERRGITLRKSVWRWTATDWPENESRRGEKNLEAQQQQKNVSNEEEDNGTQQRGQMASSKDKNGILFLLLRP